MITTPNLRVERLSKLEPGELINFQHGAVRCVGLVCDYRDPEPAKLLLVLGPKFPPDISCPTLLDFTASAVSIGNAFEIRLPVDVNAWSEVPPANDCNCLLVTSEGIFFRANGSLPVWGKGFVACYVNAATGVVQMRNGGYAMPQGIAAFAKSWELVTTEEEPRTVLKYPFASK